MSLGFKLYTYFNGNLVHQDSQVINTTMTKIIPLKMGSLCIWFWTDSLPTQFHNYYFDDILTFKNEESNLESLVKRRVQKHSVKHKETNDKGYNSWQPK